MSATPPKTIIRMGKIGAIEQPPIVTSDPRLGASTTRKFHGKVEDLLPLVPAFAAAGWSISVNPISPVSYEMVCTIGLSWTNSGVQDNPVDTWDLTSNRVEKDLLQADLPIINGLSDDDKQLIRSTLEQNPSTIPTTLTGNALQVYKDMRDGFDHFPVYAPVLRRTQTVSGVYSSRSTLVGVTQIYSTATMLADSTKANGNGQGVPASLQVDLSTITSLYSNSKSGYAYGWYKDFPNITIAAHTKTQIHQDYIYGLWPLAYYNTPL